MAQIRKSVLIWILVNMSNYADVIYKITGPSNLLEFINEACNSRKELAEVLHYLDPNLDSTSLSEFELRGEIIYAEIRDGILTIISSECWDLSDFYCILKDRLPDLNITWYVEEPGDCIFKTNDVDGVYFPGRYRLEYLNEDTNEYEYEFLPSERKLTARINELMTERGVNEDQIFYNEIDVIDDR